MATMTIPLTAPTFGGKPNGYDFTGTIQLPQVIADPIQINSATLYYGWGRCYYRDTFIAFDIGSTSFYSDRFTTENDSTLRERTVGLVCTAVGSDHLLKVQDRTVYYRIKNNRNPSGNIIDRPRDGNMILTLDYDVLTSACTPPTALSVSADLAEGNVTLSGAGAGAGVNNAITGYEVSRCESSDGVNWGGWQVLQTVAATGTSFSLVVAPPDTRGNRYKYRAQTLGSAGAGYYSGYKESSNILRRNAAPSAPGSLTPSATVYEAGGLTLSWPAASDPDGNLSYYELQYQSSADAVNWSDWAAAGTAAGLNLAAYPSLTRAWYIRYRIRAVDALGVASGWTVSASIRRNSLPSTPASLAASATLYESGGLTLSWPGATDIDGNLSGYRVQAAVSADGVNWAAWATVQTVTGTSLVATPSLARGQYVKYRVCALDALGAESGYRESAAIRRYALSTVALSKSSVNAGEPISAVITPMAGGLTHRVTWVFGGQKQANELGKDSAADTLDVPLPWLDQIPKAVSGAASCTVETVLNGVVLGSVSASFTIVCPASIVPEIGTLSALPVSDTVPGAWGLYVKGHSRARVTAGGIAPGTGATIVSISLYGGGGSAAGAELLSPVLATAGMLVFTCTVTDSRGRTAQKTVNVLVTDYQGPRLNDLSVFRANAAGVESRDGTRVAGTLAYGFDLIGENSAGLKLYVDDGLVADVALSPQGVHYPISLAGPFDIMRTYALRAVITDGLGVSATVSATINTARRQINIGAGLHGGIGLGMMALVGDAVQMPGNWPLLIGSLNVAQELAALRSYVDQQMQAASRNALEKENYIGCLRMQTVSTNPATLLGFGTWVAWGQGRVPVGVGSNGTTNYTAAEQTGGAESHAHAVASHTHSIASHTHYVASHGHSIASHTHYVPSHAHTTAAMVLTEAQMPSHTHTPSYAFWGENPGANDWTIRWGDGNQLSIQRSKHMDWKGGNAAHGHGDTGGTALTTGGTALWTDGTAMWTDGTALTTAGTALTTNAGDGRQPYITCYIFKRTA